LAVLKRSCDCCADQPEREDAAGKESRDLLFHGAHGSREKLWLSCEASIADRSARILTHISQLVAN
jgi:hypothetical protein